LVPEIAPHVIEFGTDTTRSIASIVFSGTAARYPDIRWIWSHAGGTMPFLIARFEDAAEEPETAKRLPNVLMYELQRLSYDTAQSAHPVTITTLAKVIPSTQVVFGTDFPFREGAQQVSSLSNCGF
jgi:predicted TIM-barrel fold metal-dependent hydrolase